MKLSKKDVGLLFSTLETQSDVMIGIMKLLYPNWEQIEKIEGWPACNRETSRWICDRFMAFDRVYHPDTMQGGCWLNYGFSTLDPEGLADWEIRLAPVKLKVAA